jgi:hypothetical protein
MKSKIRVIITLAILIALIGGCSPLIGVAPLASFGLGVVAGSRNVQPQVVREYYIDGVKVEDPAALGLE